MGATGPHGVATPGSAAPDASGALGHSGAAGDSSMPANTRVSSTSIAAVRTSLEKASSSSSREMTAVSSAPPLPATAAAAPPSSGVPSGWGVVSSGSGLDSVVLTMTSVRVAPSSKGSPSHRPARVEPIGN